MGKSIKRGVPKMENPPAPPAQKGCLKPEYIKVDITAINDIERQNPEHGNGSIVQRIWVRMRKYCIDNYGRRPENVVLNIHQAYKVYDYIIANSEFNLNQNDARIFGMRIIEATNIKEDEVFLF